MIYDITSMNEFYRNTAEFYVSQPSKKICDCRTVLKDDEGQVTCIWDITKSSDYIGLLYFITQRNLLTNEHNVILTSVYTQEED